MKPFKQQRFSKPNTIKEINKYTAGVDIGSMEHWIAVSPELTETFVRKSATFTKDLMQTISWLKSLKIKSVAMESTGVYWIPFYEMLEKEGFEVLLVNARHVKNVPGRKSDVLDCQWIQQLHSYGLLRGSFRPEEGICALRGVMRQRDMLVKEMSHFKLRIQKTLSQMNIQLHNVISDITGDLGLKILTGIIDGNHDPKSLAQLKTGQYKSSRATIEKSLEGNYRQEHILCLKQALDLYAFFQKQLQECDAMAQKILDDITPFSKEEGPLSKSKPEGKRKRRKNELYFDAKDYIVKLSGVDLTKVPGLDQHSALRLLSEIGTDMSKWNNEKQFASWLGLAPGTKISGGKTLSTRTKKCKNRAAHIFRMSAFTLARSDCEIGAFFRRKKAQLGAPEAITATAHKLARVIYHMMKEKKAFIDLGSHYYEHKHKERLISRLKQRAESLGLMLVENVEHIVKNLPENVVNLGKV